MTFTQTIQGRWTKGRDDIEGKMLAINAARCQLPMREAEVRRMVGHAVRRYSG